MKFEKCSIQVNGTLVDEIYFINIAMPVYNLTEYSDNYYVTSGSLQQFKRDENVDTNENVCNAKSS